MSKDNHSRIPMRGFSSRIPMPGSSSSSSTATAAPSSQQTQLNHNKITTPKTKLTTTKLTRPTDIPLSNFVRPTVVTQKISQITKTSLTNLTSRIITRQFSANSEQQQQQQRETAEATSHDKAVEMQELHRTHEVLEGDQMLIDETIDLVGSDDNMLRYASKESIQSQLQQQQQHSAITQTPRPPNSTFDLARRDGTFIKSPTRGGPCAIGSVNSLPDAKETPTNSARRAVSKSRDSLNHIQMGNQTRVIHLRKSGNDFNGSSLSLTKSPDWGSEDMLIDSPIDMNGCVFNSTLITQEQLLEVTPYKPFFVNDTHVNATQLLCMTPSSSRPQAMEVDECDATVTNVTMRMNENARAEPQKRFSFGLDITECTLDCSIELCDTSMSSTMHKASPMDKQGSFDVDESLGILTPDQMKEFLDSTNTNHTNNLELPLIPGHKLSHQCRIDQTPSPEELPLDPVGVKMTEEAIQQQQPTVSAAMSTSNQEVSQAESDPKTDMTKSATSKVSSSIITSITSITSLDTGYIGDGEMSRPASRGAAADQSPSKVPRNQPPANWNAAAQEQPQQAAAVHRQRQDPMTDSDFFTESDADDIFHQRENQRRAQVIDGQLYGPMLQGANVIFQQQQPQESDSCMESSGVFTDVENRGDDELLHRLAENRENIQHHANDMSPDLSSDTVTSSGTACSQKKTLHAMTPSPTQQHHHQRHNHHSNSSIDRPREFIIETSSSICSMMTDECCGAVTGVSETNASETINLISESSFGSTKSSCAPSEDADSNVCDTSNKSGGSGCSASAKKALSSASGKKSSGTNRKTHKNEANFGLKKHEMSSRGAVKASAAEKVSSAKKCLNGKWEPVMNKIAENKSVKKNFDNVKSKVTCGVVKRTTTTGSIKTPPSDDHSLASLSTESAVAAAKKGAGAKDSSPLLPPPPPPPPHTPSSSSVTGNKRGRAFSKDSQQSSQSDLSLNGAAGSPKIIKSSATRAAKKRDVRTISSSPSDLGPPPSKTTTNSAAQRSNARTITVSQKRTSPQQIIAPTTPISQIDQLKASPPAKKTVPRRGGVINGSPLQQHKDRLAQQQQQPASSINGSPRSSLRSNHSSKAGTPPPSALSAPSAAHRNGIMIDALNVSPKGGKELENNNSTKIINKNNANVNKMQQQQQQQEQLLQQIIDRQTTENQKQMMELLHANKGVEALGVLVQHLVYNLDAFACPSIKKSQQKTAKQLLEARDYIDEMKSSYHSLEEKLNEREEYFNKREIELQELHRCEMLKAQKLFEDLQNEKASQERSMTEMQVENEQKIQKLAAEAEDELQIAKDREDDLLKRIQQLTLTEDELREKVHSSELEFSEKLQNAMMKERELSEKINSLTKTLDDLKSKTESEKRGLEEKLNLSQDELSVIRQSRNSISNESFQNRSMNTSWQDEVESLRCVLELKQSEISELRKTNCELQRAADEATSAQFRCSALESRVEDLQVQLHAKNEEEKELIQKLKTLQEQHDNATLKSSRLSLHNEELQWRLKQNAEKYTMTLNELSKSYHESSATFNRTNMSIHEFDFSGGSKSGNGSTLDAENGSGSSPPPSPIIKGVVEKSDSVSWVLEMDDETPEVLATRLVRRAGSFRSDKCSPSPVPKRQKCQNNTSIQQSASATSILRQHSEPSPLKANGRLRSKSVSASKAAEPHAKACIPHIVRSMSTNGSSVGAAVRNLSETAGWKQNKMQTSSPNPKKTSARDELIIEDEDFEGAAAGAGAAGKSDFFHDDGAVLSERETFHRDTAPKFKKSRENRGLITCDTAALASNEMIMKAHRRPKASAGEIKFSVSGSNSEEEELDEEHSLNSSSASSTVSTGPSTPSMSSTATSSSGGSNKQPIESIEDALLRWKEHNNTPMEVSWCEGEADGPTESCV